MPGRGLRMRAWAEEVDEEEEGCSPTFDEAAGQYRATNSNWHEELDVKRGMAEHRLDTRHGFFQSIVSQRCPLKNTSFFVKVLLPQCGSNRSMNAFRYAISKQGTTMSSPGKKPTKKLAPSNSAGELA